MTPGRERKSRHRRLSIALLSMLAGGLTLDVAPARSVRGHVFDHAFGEPCVLEPCAGGTLKEPAGAAVNESSGDVYVADKGDNRVDRFSSTGTYLGQFDGSGKFDVEGKKEESEAAPTGQLLSPESVAVDNDPSSPSFGDIYALDGGHEVIDKFDPTGAYIGQIAGTPETGPFLELRGVAVDSAGRVWVADRRNKGFDTFSNAVANEFIAFRAATVGNSGCGEFQMTPGLAIDSEEDVYAGTTFPGGIRVIAKFNANGEQLSCAMDQQESSGTATELSSNDVYVDNIESVGRFDSKGSPIERLGVPGMQGSGVGVSAATGQVYIPDSVAGIVDVFALEPPGAPTLAGESVLEVTGNSATLTGEINPRGADTEYHFEYGRCATPSTCGSSPYEKSLPLPAGVVAGSFAVRAVSVHPQDLVAGVIYHFRLVALNKFGRHDGEEQTFTTQTAGPFALPDGREWELVSPPNKRGALIEPIRAPWVIQASVAGDAITYVTQGPTEAEPQGAPPISQVLSVRSSDRWASHDIATPHETATGSVPGYGEEYRFFSEDLTLGVVHPVGAFDSSLSAEASGQTSYLRTNAPPGDVTDVCQYSCYRPLVTSKSGFTNVPPGTVLAQCDTGKVCGPEFVGATPESNNVVLESAIGLTSAPGDDGGLYEWSGGRLALISVLPDGRPAAFASSPALGYRDGNARHAISPDGSRIVWSDEEEGSRHLYMRDMHTGKTVQLDSGLAGAPVFQIADTSVSTVFFTEEGTRPGVGDLYEYDVQRGEQVRLTEDAEVLGAVLGASDDGSYLYFVANGILARGAVAGTCGAAFTATDMCNLYVQHGEATKLVSVLSGADSPDWAKGAPSDLKSLTARVSPDGRWLAFMSQQRLTAYNNLDALSGKPDEEVYLYDAADEQVICASCNPTSARPVGSEYRELADKLVGGDSVWPPATWLAANIPGWTPYELGKARHQSRYLSDSGRLFFDSRDALVPQDVNGAEDVYELEPLGVGDCTAASAAFSERSRGCVGLISSGNSGQASAFLDASAGGGDVFFLTTAKLSPQDLDTALDVYDAHQCIAAAPCLSPPFVQPPPCSTGDSCKPPPSPQPEIFGPGPSETPSGTGNAPFTAKLAPRPLSRAQQLARALRGCRRQHLRSRRRRAICERRARKHYSARRPATGHSAVDRQMDW